MSDASWVQRFVDRARAEGTRPSEDKGLFPMSDAIRTKLQDIVGAHDEAAILGRSADRRCRYARGMRRFSRGGRGPARSAPPREAARRGVVERHEVG